MPSHATDAVAGFLKSPNGVYSALFLLTDELAMIKEDNWNINIWGVSRDDHSERAKTPHTAVPLRFYFGAQDVWVWNEARDRLIASRGRPKDEATDIWKPLMIIDDTDVPHGFVVDHNQIIAEKTFDLISQLIRESGVSSFEAGRSW